jgi:hypothetical protein
VILSSVLEMDSMHGEGVKDYLKDIGRDVASSLGEELKGVAKDKATSFVKEQFGLGFKDELKSAGRDILSSVGDELTGAAKDKATAMIKEQLGLGYGGDGIARPCSVPVAKLRRAVTAARKANHVTGAANRAQLMHLGETHADLEGKQATRIRKAYMEQSPILVGDLREMRSEIKSYFHPHVSSMRMDDLISYVFWTAKDLKWSWSQLDGIGAKTRQPRGCRAGAAPGRSRDAPARKKRAPSKYNLHIRSHMAANPDGDVRERFTDAVEAWNRGAGRRSGASAAASTRAFRKENRDDYTRKRAASAKRRIAGNRSANAAEYERRGRDPAVAAVRRSARIPKKQSGRGAAYDSGSESESDGY